MGEHPLVPPFPGRRKRRGWAPPGLVGRRNGSRRPPVGSGSPRAPRRPVRPRPGQRVPGAPAALRGFKGRAPEGFPTRVGGPRLAGENRRGKGKLWV